MKNINIQRKGSEHDNIDPLRVAVDNFTTTQ